jgi:GMP synthase (glutamine-hydrolysing)
MAASLHPSMLAVHHLDPIVFDFARAHLPGVTEVSRAAGDPLPDLDGVDALVVMGGAQSVVTIGDDPPLTAEAAWIAAAVARGIPVLGVCLGAQLLAHALGGRVFRLPRRLLRWEPLQPTAAAAGDPVLGALPAGAHGVHWNEDGLEPPPGAVELLERGARGSCAAFRYGDAAWGVQFHPELGPASLDHWYAHWPSALAEAGVNEAAARAQDARHLPVQPALAEAIFGGFAAYAGVRSISSRSLAID